LAIVGEDYAYVIVDTTREGGDTLTAIGNIIASRHHGCRFVVGEDVQYSQEKGTLFVIDADGKECKATILRQERRPPPPATQVLQPGVTPPGPARSPQKEAIQRPTVRQVDHEPPTVAPQTAAVVGTAPKGQDTNVDRPAPPSARNPGVSAPTLISKVEPRYSDEARQAGIEGTVVLYSEVGPDGLAHNTRVRRSLGHGLDENAIEAVSSWRWRPGEKDGKPVTVAANIEVNFRLLHPPISKEMADQSAAYIQKQLGIWQPADALPELGVPTAHRVAVDQHGAAYGEVLTYPDPTNTYQKFDLTFDDVSKKLREIRVYPGNVTLQQCRAIWGDKFEVQQRPDGLSLYIYRDQRVSVLARDTGEVLSFDFW
jgi:TonB family protein